MFPCFTFVSLAQTISYKDRTQIYNIISHFPQKGNPNTWGSNKMQVMHGPEPQGMHGMLQQKS